MSEPVKGIESGCHRVPIDGGFVDGVVSDESRIREVGGEFELDDASCC